MDGGKECEAFGSGLGLREESDCCVLEFLLRTGLEKKLDCERQTGELWVKSHRQCMSGEETPIEAVYSYKLGQREDPKTEAAQWLQKEENLENS